MVPMTSVGRALVCGGAEPVKELAMPMEEEIGTASVSDLDACELGSIKLSENPRPGGGTEAVGVLDASGLGSNKLTEMPEPGGKTGAVGEDVRKLALESNEAETVGSAVLAVRAEDPIPGGRAPGGVEVSEQMVVVTLTTTVEV